MKNNKIICSIVVWQSLLRVFQLLRNSDSVFNGLPWSHRNSYISDWCYGLFFRCSADDYWIENLSKLFFCEKRLFSKIVIMSFVAFVCLVCLVCWQYGGYCSKVEWDCWKNFQLLKWLSTAIMMLLVYTASNCSILLILPRLVEHIFSFQIALQWQSIN